jgi:hypothetical protein
MRGFMSEFGGRAATGAGVRRGRPIFPIQFKILLAHFSLSRFRRSAKNCTPRRTPAPVAALGTERMGWGSYA